MVAAPNNFIFAQARAISYERAPHPKPGHNGIEQTSHRVNGEVKVLCEGTEISFGHQAEAVVHRLPIQSCPASYELINLVPGLGIVTKAKAGEFSIAKKDGVEKGQRHGTAHHPGQARSPPRR